MSLPDTRESLLIRLADTADAAAWDEFVAIYRPVIVRLGLRRGLQPNDADDLAQRVLMSVSRVIGDWEKDPAVGSFRSWLRAVARNAITNTLQRGPKEMAVGGSDFLDVCNTIESPARELDRLIDDEHDRCVLRIAAARVEQQVNATTWQAFWRTTIQGESPRHVAGILGVSVGKIYGARSRVMKMLGREVAELLDQ
ncbi:MAG: sigma-70 family RNA polymerase sigma factor [Pirellulaceae bacterium]|jgi:RNA polymerase sigma-70 factor (ECF subfamily)|nr:sigma-70 family RNA polymerase sigma factor [Pirellulaceae bacterium]MDP7018177.1 sigma-70 family RNA polymerase sigma factor [Pirellulaceae bacterium]